jgi:hypothetical protein
MDKIQEFKDKIRAQQVKIDAIDKDWDYSRPYSEYMNKVEAFFYNIEAYNREIRLLDAYTLSPISGHLMTIESFSESVDDGVFMDDDGIGYYANIDQQSDINVCPSDFEYNRVRTDFTHVSWYNR